MLFSPIHHFSVKHCQRQFWFLGAKPKNVHSRFKIFLCRTFARNGLIQKNIVLGFSTKLQIFLYVQTRSLILVGRTRETNSLLAIVSVTGDRFDIFFVFLANFLFLWCSYTYFPFEKTSSWAVLHITTQFFLPAHTAGKGTALYQ